MTEKGPLEAEIQRRTADGWEIGGRQANEVQMRRPKQFSLLSAFIGSLLLVVGLIVYLLWYWAKRDEYVYIRLEGDKLTVTESGGPLANLFSPVAAYFRWAANRQQAWMKGVAVGGPFATGAALIAAVVVVISVVVASDEDEPPSIPVEGVAELCQPLAKAERHRYTFSFTLDSPQPQGDVDETALGEPPFALLPNAPDFFFSQEFEGAVENPDKLELISRTVGAVGEIHMLFIGNNQWISLGENLNPAHGQAIPFPPVLMCNAMVTDLDLTGVEPTEDTIDGVKTLRYEVEDAELETAASIWTAQSDQGRVVKKYTVTVWLSEDGNMPVRLESRGLGTLPSGREITTELMLEVRDINAGDIKIEPPS